jgi:hypothetical protein
MIRWVLAEDTKGKCQTHGTYKESIKQRKKLMQWNGTEMFDNYWNTGKKTDANGKSPYRIGMERKKEKKQRKILTNKK